MCVCQHSMPSHCKYTYTCVSVNILYHHTVNIHNTCVSFNILYHHTVNIHIHVCLSTSVWWHRMLTDTHVYVYLQCDGIECWQTHMYMYIYSPDTILTWSILTFFTYNKFHGCAWIVTITPRFIWWKNLWNTFCAIIVTHYFFGIYKVKRKHNVNKAYRNTITNN
jgi:hypothetical protein